ncbi:MAG: S8 family serine peptidase [Pseudomonadota bacterium]|nr:S8 family serine peptidase [Pseudomonadota bacterium]
MSRLLVSGWALTTGHQPQQRLLTWTNATSAACALCARMAAQLMAAYPELRPDTIRALIVHSAEWTENMREMFLPAKPKVPTKNDYLKLTQHCGFGVPNLERALWSAGNSLTLVAEDEIHPFRKKGSDIKTRDMKLHTLPWPKDELEALGDVPVEMRVTLSYFRTKPISQGSTIQISLRLTPTPL